MILDIKRFYNIKPHVNKPTPLQCRGVMKSATKVQ